MKQENFDNLSSWYYGWEKIDTSDFSVLKNYFYNLYSPVGKIEELLKLHVFQNRTIPENDLQRIINNFREVYPINERKSELKGFYFDDRIGTDIELYRKTLNNPLQFEILENEFRIVENEKKYREERINIEDGTTYTRYKDIIKSDENDYFIEFNPNIEAEKRFKDVDALKYFNQELRHFFNNNTKPTLESVSIELDKIHKFIQDANSLDLAKIKRTVFESEVNKMIEYRRLKSGYYLEKKFTEYFNFYEYETKFVYGKFILFKDWLETKIIELSAKIGLEKNKTSDNSIISAFSLTKKVMNKSIYKGRSEIFQSHFKLYEALIMATEEKEENKVEEAYEYLMEIWYFVNSDYASFNGKEIEYLNRPLYVNSVIIGKPDFNQWFSGEKLYDQKRRKIKLVESDFNHEFGEWIKIQIEKPNLRVERRRKYIEFLDYIKIKSLKVIGLSEPEKKWTIDQIALKFAYEGGQITRSNGDEIAKKFGHNSGEKLFQRFTYYSSSTNRKAKPNLCTQKKLSNKIKLIESVIELLPKDKKERATAEVKILKDIYDDEFQ